MTIDKLAELGGVKVDKNAGSYLWGRARFGRSEALLIKPLTFMNLSGEAVKEALACYKLSIDSLFVIYDDVDLAPGRIQVINELGASDFKRLRMGIGGRGEGALVDYVLSPFDDTELEVIREEVARGASAIDTALRRGLREAMNEFNRKPV